MCIKTGWLTILNESVYLGKKVVLQHLRCLCLQVQGCIQESRCAFLMQRPSAGAL